MNGQRVNRLRKREDLTLNGLANKCGVSRNTVWRWENNKQEPSLEMAQKLASALNTSVAYLMGETDNPARPGERRPEIESNVLTLNKAILIPVVTEDVSVCCGNGSMYPSEVKWEIVGYYPMDETDLIGYTWQTKDFCIIKATGDSMEPHISDGDRVFFAQAPDVEVTNGDFAVLMLDGKLLIRAVFLQGGRTTLRAANEVYKDIIITDFNELYILGKVLGVVPAYRKTTGLW